MTDCYHTCWIWLQVFIRTFVPLWRKKKPHEEIQNKESQEAIGENKNWSLMLPRAAMGDLEAVAVSCIPWQGVAA